MTLNPPSRSASLTSRLRNAPYLLASYYTFCLNPRQSSRGLCRVQVVIEGSRILPEPPTAYTRPSPLLYLILVKQAILLFSSHSTRHCLLDSLVSSLNIRCDTPIYSGTAL